MKLTRKCFGCKEEFNKNELVEYFTFSGKTSNWYCQKCLAEKQARERFSDKVCEIFGLKSPGPVIWTQRKRIQAQYGYTDETIIQCLEYMYKVEKRKILTENLYLVNPTNVEKALKYNSQQSYENAKLISAITNQQMQEYNVKIKENAGIKKVELNPDDFLNDD